MALDVQGLMKSCPTLRACYREALRLDTAPVGAYKVRRNFTVAEPRRGIFGAEQSSTYLLHAGEFIAIPLALQSQDPCVFEAPGVFRPERFLGAGEEGVKGEIAESDDSISSDDIEMGGLGKGFREKVILAFVAGLLALWEFETVGEGGWVVPGHGASPGYMQPDCDVRVRVRRRVVR